MKRFSVNTQLIIKNAGIFLLIVLILITIILPTLKKIEALQKEITSIHKSMEIDYQKTRQMKRTLNELSAIEKEIDNIKKSFITPGQELSVIIELEGLAKKYSITQTLHANSTNIQLPNSDGVDYTFSFLNHGTFENHMNFLYEMERLPYYINISNLQWEKRSGSLEEDTSITLRFDGHIYAETTN